MDKRFDGRVAIVTGAASGIGAAIAARFAAEGAKVVIADVKEDAAQAAAAQLGQEAIGIGCDVGDEDQVQACVAKTLGRFGRFDIVVNNAGLMTFKKLSEWTAADWLKVLRVDLLGAAFFTKQLFLHVGDGKPAGQGGAIVNIASVHAVETSANAAPYTAAKAGMLGLTHTSAIEGRDLKIRANVVLPGAIDTPMLWANPNVKSGAETIDKRDVGQPEDVAAAVAFLASDDARFITGASLAVDGGRLAKL